jgi:hypothetical protein
MDIEIWVIIFLLIFLFIFILDYFRDRKHWSLRGIWEDANHGWHTTGKGFLVYREDKMSKEEGEVLKEIEHAHDLDPPEGRPPIDR